MLYRMMHEPNTWARLKKYSGCIVYLDHCHFIAHWKPMQKRMAVAQELCELTVPGGI